MKLRFRNNTLRLRVNQREVRSLALGQALREQVRFPGSVHFGYRLMAGVTSEASASFEDGIIQVVAPKKQVEQWAACDDIGMYFDLATDGNDLLRVAVEKDLECLDEPVNERDPHAFPRGAATDKSC